MTETGQPDPMTRTSQVGQKTWTGQAGPMTRTGHAGPNTQMGWPDETQVLENSILISFIKNWFWILNLIQIFGLDLNL